MHALLSYTYCFAIQIVHATVHVNAVAQVCGDVDNARRLVEVREGLVRGGFVAVFDFVFVGRVGERR